MASKADQYISNFFPREPPFFFSEATGRWEMFQGDYPGLEAALRARFFRLLQLDAAGRPNPKQAQNERNAVEVRSFVAMRRAPDEADRRVDRYCVGQYSHTDTRCVDELMCVCVCVLCTSGIDLHCCPCCVSRRPDGFHDGDRDSRSAKWLRACRIWQKNCNADPTRLPHHPWHTSPRGH